MIDDRASDLAENNLTLVILELRADTGASSGDRWKAEISPNPGQLEKDKLVSFTAIVESDTGPRRRNKQWLEGHTFQNS